MHKVYLVMRTDLQMRRGKEIAQAAHATQYLMQMPLESRNHMHQEWLEDGHARIAVGMSTLQGLNDLLDHADRCDIPHAFVLDEGRTDVPPDTITCAAIGPVTISEAAELGLDRLKLR